MSIRPNFMNEKSSFVSEALDGLVMLHAERLERIAGTQIIRLRNPNLQSVSLICGGGSGHEPAHAGFVHPLMLTGAVCGGVFASPSHQEVLTAILSVPNENGVLLIIKNYTGDVINFELAASIARTRGIQVQTIVFGDDIAFETDKRGLAGTVLLYKILGAYAQKGYSLDNLKSLGEKIALKISTIGVSLSSCSIPGNPSTFSLPENYLEIGLGIHGEKGKLQKPIRSAREIVNDMLDHFNFQNNIPLVVLLNNLGSTTDLEMGVITREVLLQLKSKGILVHQAISGRIMTSLEMHGFSLTILPLDFSEETQEISNAIQERIDNGNWTTLKQINQTVSTSTEINLNNNCEAIAETPSHPNQFDSIAHQLFSLIFSGLAKKSDYFNKLDALVGDGDTGEGVLRSCNAVLKLLPTLDLMTQFTSSLRRIAEEIASTFGGTSGALYGVFLLNGSLRLKDNFNENDSHSLAEGLELGMQRLAQIGNSNKGDRTMLDVLYSIHERLLSLHKNSSGIPLGTSNTLQALVHSSNEASQQTSQLKAKKGRSRYLDGREIGNLDPGCEIIVAWISILSEFFSTN